MYDLIEYNDELFKKFKNVIRVASYTFSTFFRDFFNNLFYICGTWMSYNNYLNY